MTSADQTWILIRHAHRSTKNGQELDNGLSSKGKNQARKLKKYFKKTFGESKPLILSSPKKRCIETVERIAKVRKVEVQTSKWLNEGDPLDAKCRALIEELGTSKRSLIILCSHGDVLPVLIYQLTGARVDMAKGAWVQIERVGSVFRLTWILQNF